MNDLKWQRHRLHILLDPTDPDAVLVTDVPLPEAIPVIPTPVANSYWAYPAPEAVS